VNPGVIVFKGVPRSMGVQRCESFFVGSGLFPLLWSSSIFFFISIFVASLDFSSSSIIFLFSSFLFISSSSLFFLSSYSSFFFFSSSSFFFLSSSTASLAFFVPFYVLQICGKIILLSYFIGPINPSYFVGHIFILTTTGYFTKWIEEVSLKHAQDEQIISFLESNYLLLVFQSKLVFIMDHHLYM
jgi:hypothetical protein